MANDASQFRRELAPAIAIMLALVLLAGGSAIYVVADPDLQSAFAMARTAYGIRQQYPDAADWERLVDRAITEMTDRLDPYSFYIDSVSMAFMHEEFTGAYGGIGVSVIPHEDGLRIMTVREGGPSHRYGLLPGDIIIAAGEQLLAGLSPERCTALLRGRPGTPVTITVVRPATGDTLSLTLTRERIRLLHVPFAGITPDSALYIRVLDFEAGAADDIRSALDSLLTPERPRPLGLILDLRGNPGGLLGEARRAADLFLEGGQLIVGTETRYDWQREEWRSTGRDRTGGLPMVVLVDRGSASAAEIVSGALQQLERATLVGDTTFGKGLVQGFFSFADGSGLRLTIARYYLAGGIHVSRFDSTGRNVVGGLVPDIVRLSEAREPFPRALENALLLRQFAEQYQDEIIAAGDTFTLDRTWRRRLEQFAAAHGFRYRSRVTRRAEEVAELAAMLSEPGARRTAGRLVALAEQLDRQAWDAHADFIARRLRRYAYERAFGQWRAYRDVIVRDSPIIRFAASLLKRKTT